MSVSFIKVNDLITIVAGGQSHQVDKNHQNYKMIIDALRERASDQEVLLLITGPNMNPDNQPVVVTLTASDFDGYQNFSFDGTSGRVLLDGSEVDRKITSYFEELKSLGLPFDSMVLFVEKLYKSVEHRVRSELLEFIKNNGLTINSEGNVLFYKAVRSDYMDKYSGTFSNAVGNVVSMDRSKVDNNRRHHCSAGLHCGGLEYIYWYGGGDDRIVIVEVDPRDVVSVPEDHNARKVRVCKYNVIADYNGRLKNLAYEKDDDLYDQEENEEDSHDWEFAETPRCAEEDDVFEDGDIQVLSLDDDTPRMVGLSADDASELVSIGCGIDDFEDDDDDDEESLAVVEDDFEDEVSLDEDDFGTKPNGNKFWNRRDSSGRFTAS